MCRWMRTARWWPATPRENRQQFQRQELETVYLPGLTATELTEVGNLAKNVFDAQQAVVEPTAGTITIRAPPSRRSNAFNATMSELLDGADQVLLDVRLIQIAHTSSATPASSRRRALSAFNVYAEEQSILNANQSPGAADHLLGPGCSRRHAGDSWHSAGLRPGVEFPVLQRHRPVWRRADAIRAGSGLGHGQPEPELLRLARTGPDAIAPGRRRGRDTCASGTRYPIQTSSFSSLSASVPNIPGLTGAGSSSSLSSLLASYGSSVPNVPQVEYQDLGLTLKANPKVMRNDDVALTIDMKIDALAGTSINGNPILNNRAYSGVVTLKQGEAVVVVSELDKSESRAISGTPGISEIPGLNDLTGNDTQKNYATLLIVITPHVIRGTQAAGHSPMLRIERGPSRALSPVPH